MNEIEKLLVAMLNIPSVSGEEKNLGLFLISQLDGFRIEKQFVQKDRFNIIAKKGRPEVYIVVHMDTVPGNIPVKITPDKIFGRGAVDNKGNIAGAILAARKRDNIGLIFTVGEEIDFAGAKKIAIKNGKFIVMEPTRLKIMRAQRGVIGIDIAACGTQMHSSLNFKKEQSAVYLITELIQELYAKNWTAFNAIITSGGEADNIVCAKATGKVAIRPKDMREYQDIISFIKNFKRKNIRLLKTFAIAPCESALAKKGGTALFFSEMAFFKNSLLFGAGDISVAHTDHEYIKRKELTKLEPALLKLIAGLEKK